MSIQLNTYDFIHSYMIETLTETRIPIDARIIIIAFFFCFSFIHLIFLQFHTWQWIRFCFVNRYYYYYYFVQHSPTSYLAYMIVLLSTLYYVFIFFIEMFSCHIVRNCEKCFFNNVVCKYFLFVCNERVIS